MARKSIECRGIIIAFSSPSVFAIDEDTNDLLWNLVECRTKGRVYFPPSGLGLCALGRYFDLTYRKPGWIWMG